MPTTNTTNTTNTPNNPTPNAPAPTQDERRRAPRIAGCGPVQAVTLDHGNRPTEVMRHAQVHNVSAGGLALLSSTQTHPGTHIDIMLTPEPGQYANNPQPAVRVKTLACNPFQGHLFKTRCTLTTGQMPAELIYNW